MSQAQALYHLQQIELEILSRQQRLQEIAKNLEDRRVIEKASKQVQKAEAIRAPLQKNIRELEHQIQSNVNKTQGAEDRLYSGIVKNPKELQDLQNEITSLKKRHGELEDQMLELMMQAEEAQAMFDAAQTKLSDITAQWESDHKHLLDEQKELQAEIERYEPQRDAAIAKIDPPHLTTYNALKPRKANRPVSVLQGGSCSICGIQQTVSNDQAIKQGENLIACSNCGRILVYLGT